jgi:hypothetical protein
MLTKSTIFVSSCRPLRSHFPIPPCKIFKEELATSTDSSTISDQDRLLDIIRNFTHRLFYKVCQSIFEKDKLLFTFMLAFRILEGEGCLYYPLYEFFVKGPQAVIFISKSDKNSQEKE